MNEVMGTLPDLQELSVLQLIERHRETYWNNLDSKLKMFAYEYLKEYNHRNSAALAGFPKNDGLRILREPVVQAFIQDITDDRQVTTNITKEYISTMWMRMLPKLMGEEEVAMVTSSGEEKTACKFFASEAVSAIREMGKSTKFYEDGSGGTVLNLSLAIDMNMSPAEASAQYMKIVQGERL